MINREDIVWLDGYLKGITAFKRELANFTFNALLIRLAGTDIVQSYMDFININDEVKDLGIEFSPLTLTKCKSVNKWSKIVAANISNAFTGLKVESYQGVISQVLDILDIIVLESKAKRIFICFAEMGKASGEYLFFQLTDDEYLVLSFLRHESERDCEGGRV